VSRSLRLLLLVCLGASALLTGQGALAGRPCTEPQPFKVDTLLRSLDLARRTAEALDRSGARVVVLARAGQDLRKYGLRYSHLGLAYQIRDAEGNKLWRVLHKLNQCGSAESALYRQGLGEFFLDDLWQYEAAWVVPAESLQTRLANLLADEVAAVRLHHRPYSMVSYAWGLSYQQSNQWALETMALALDNTASHGAAPPGRAAMQSWLRAQDYRPTVLKIDALTRLGARLTAANVAFDDHPPEKRYSDRIETVTVDSVFDWLQRAGLSQQPPEVLR
jgi:hypothetical protein